MNKAILSEPKHPVGRRPRVLIFIVGYPTFSETYMHEEIRSLARLRSKNTYLSQERFSSRQSISV